MKKVTSVLVTTFLFLASFVGSVFSAPEADSRPLNPKNEGPELVDKELKSDWLEQKGMEDIADREELVDIDEMKLKIDDLEKAEGGLDNPTVEGITDEVKDEDLDWKR